MDEVEMGRLAQRTVAQLVLARADDPKRNRIMQAAIEPLTIADTLTLSGAVISQLCEIFDGMSNNPVMQQRVVDVMENLLLELDLGTDGIVGA